MPIKTVIFDLGDVLMPLNRQRTYDAFQSLGVHDAEKLFAKDEFKELYIKLEQDLDTSVFRTRLRELCSLNPDITDKQIDDAWSAMLEDIPEERLKYLQVLREQGYKVLLLSNTNEIHHANIQHRYGHVFAQLFHTQYYSHVLKLAKPDVAIFNYVVLNEGQKALDMLFLDDKPDNVEGAKKAGIWAVQFTVHQAMKEIDQLIERINEEMNPHKNAHILLSVFKPLSPTPQEGNVIPLGAQLGGS